jgi:glycosyltransferase involved in cell wall biosynthesis
MLAPELSVVVATQNAHDTVAACLDSLLGQSGLADGALEIIVVDGSADGTAALVAMRYPQLTPLRPIGTAGLPWLFGIGIARASGQLIALTEGHCTFPPNWAVAAIAAHHATDSPVIGGAVEPGCELSPLDWALFCCDYGQFLPPLQAGPTTDLPGNNIIFKRAILGSADSFASAGFWKTFFVHQLAAKGLATLAEPRLAVVYHRHASLAQIIRRRYDHGRCFGAMRAPTMAPLRRAIYALAGPLLPWLLTYRLVQRMRAKPAYWVRFAAVLPRAFLMLLLWSIGEWVGHLAGAGRSCERL